MIKKRVIIIILACALLWIGMGVVDRLSRRLQILADSDRDDLMKALADSGLFISTNYYENKRIVSEAGSLHATAYVPDLIKPVSEKLPLAFKPRYSSLKTREFRTKYMEKLKLAYSPLSVSEDKYRVIYSDKGSEQGFASWLNMALMGFHYATFEGVDRLFQMNTDTFGYGQWDDYFYTIDALAKKLSEVDESDLPSEASFMTDLAPSANYNDLHVNYYHVTNDETHSNRMFGREDEPRLPILGFRHMTGHFYYRIYTEFNTMIAAKMTLSEIIQERRVIAQAIWEPLPFIRDEIEHVRHGITSLRGDMASGFLSVHIRRGDKVNFEAGNLSPNLYADNIRTAMANHHRLEAVLLISDDVEFMKQIVEELSGEKFSVHLITELMTAKDELIVSNNSFQDGWHQSQLSEADADKRRKHTKGLIVSLSLMADADYVICTFSSNMCRLVQLLRDDAEETIQSLDTRWVAY